MAYFLMFGVLFDILAYFLCFDTLLDVLAYFFHVFDVMGYLPRPHRGVARHCFHPVCLSVCLCVCVSVCVCVRPNILVFYFSAIRKDIDLKFIQDTYRIVFNTQKHIDLHRSKAKVTGTVHSFLKVQSYHNN